MKVELRNPSQSLIRGGALTTAGPGMPDWEPNWIDYRSSLANVDRRQARDETVVECAHCECEIDITPAPHAPTCKSLASTMWDREAISAAVRAWASSHGGDAPVKDDWHTETGAHPTGAQVLGVFGKWNDALAYAGFTANTPRKRGRLHPDHVEGLDLLEQLDAGIRIEPPVLEEVPAGAAAAGASSSIVAVEEGAPEHRVSEPPAAAEDGGRQSVPGSLPEQAPVRRGRPPKWSRESAIAWMCEHATGGVALSANACATAGGPSHGSIQRIFGSWRSYIEATGLVAPAPGIRKTSRATAPAIEPAEPDSGGATRLGPALLSWLRATRELLEAIERDPAQLIELAQGLGAA